MGQSASEVCLQVSHKALEELGMLGNTRSEQEYKAKMGLEVWKVNPELLRPHSAGWW